MRVYPITPSSESETMLPMTSSASTERVYIIPAYSNVTPPVGGAPLTSVNNSEVSPVVTSTTAQLLVLPFVPHPSHIAAPQPQFFTSFVGHAHPVEGLPFHPATYNDPPPEYESWLSGTANSHCHNPMTPTLQSHCSCCTHVTYLNLEDRPQSQFGNNDEAQNLYPEIYHICNGHTTHLGTADSARNRDGDDESMSTTSGTETPKSDTLVMKRWVFVLLILCLLFTISLFLGISLQHFQLVRKYFATLSTPAYPYTQTVTTESGLTTMVSPTSMTTPMTYQTKDPDLFLDLEHNLVLNHIAMDNSTSSPKVIMRP